MQSTSQASQQPLLREFIHIPERTSTSDFVLKLTDGVTDAEATLRDYVITDRLVRNFDEALGLIQSAVTGGTSKAAYLHGSFGSGKSHFMAVLHALLHGERAARRRDELAGLLVKHDGWLTGRKFLLVPYHLLDAKSLEQRVLGGYVDYIRKLHPDAPIPAVHRTDALLDNARHLRGQIGDQRFIAGMPGGNAEDEWGETDPFWTTERLDTALAGAYDDELRRKLVNDLLTSWFPGFFSNASEDAEAFISLDRGLTEISRHAKELGYDALVLFLDELILWLASSIGDQQFVSREVKKVTNFVEGGDARRPIPVVSFIARQRDLRELVGKDVSGAVELSFQDTLNLASGRFDVITLEDRNLPAIARERILKPVSGDAGAAIGKAFDRTTRMRREVWDTLLGADGTTGSDIESFRAAYPFSPAFMDTLIHVSSALQRSRTALKLMRQLLVDHRDDLRLGQLVPLGDLYDVISKDGDQPFTERLKVEFETAQKLFETKLLPYLLAYYGLSKDEVERARRGSKGVDAELAARVKAFTGDDRLVKTLLLSALAPSVPALRNLTARRLSALNHGSITSPIPGGEVSQVARKIEEWASRFGEIKLIRGDDPGVALELVGIDVDSVLATATGYDSTGAKKAMVKRLLWEEMGVAASGEFLDRATLNWRGSRRSVEVLCGNVRDDQDLREDAFHPLDPVSWRVIVDYPFDEGHTPADDRNRVQQLRAGGFQARTVCWVPAAFTRDRVADLRRLVIVDAVLSGTQFDSHAQHLNPADRERARTILRSQRDALVTRLRGVLRQAYGLAAKQPADVTLGYDDHLLSLDPGLRPTLPVGAAMRDALRNLAEQMLACQFPGHPDFDPDRAGAIVRQADAKMVLDYVRKAAEDPDGRVEVDKKDRATMRRVANPLRLGEMHEAAFLIGRYWVEHFHRKAAQPEAGKDGDLKVADLLRWLDEPTPLGLDRLVANLVIACFADQTDRAWVGQYGGVLNPPPELTAVREDMRLREQPLPSEAAWAEARRRAQEIFGYEPPGPRRGRLVGLFAAELSNLARQHSDAARRLVDRLERHAGVLGLDPNATAGRLATARAAADLLDGLSTRHNNLEVVEHLAGADLASQTAPGRDSAAARIGRSIRSAPTVAEALAVGAWDTFNLIARLNEPHDTQASSILDTLRQAANDEELTTGLPEALRRARSEAMALLETATVRPIGPTPPPPPPPPTPPTVTEGSQKVTNADLNTALMAVGRALYKVFEDDPDAKVEIFWRRVE